MRTSPAGHVGNAVPSAPAPRSVPSGSLASVSTPSAFNAAASSVGLFRSTVAGRALVAGAVAPDVEALEPGVPAVFDGSDPPQPVTAGSGVALHGH